jgi:hypothetical protein
MFRRRRFDLATESLSYLRTPSAVSRRDVFESPEATRRRFPQRQAIRTFSRSAFGRSGRTVIVVMMSIIEPNRVTVRGPNKGRSSPYELFR